MEQEHLMFLETDKADGNNPPSDVPLILIIVNNPQVAPTVGAALLLVRAGNLLVHQY